MVFTVLLVWTISDISDTEEDICKKIKDKHRYNLFRPSKGFF